MEYGYVRISTRKQSIDRQIRNIRTVCPSDNYCSRNIHRNYYR